MNGLHKYGLISLAYSIITTNRRSKRLRFRTINFTPRMRSLLKLFVFTSKLRVVSTTAWPPRMVLRFT